MNPSLKERERIAIERLKGFEPPDGIILRTAAAKTATV